MKWILLLPVFLLSLSFAQAEELADIVIWNGTIYTANPRQESVEAVAIRGDQIIYAGSSEGVRLLIGESTRVIDIKGKMALPGLHDVHLHPVLALEKHTCDLPEQNTFSLSELVAELQSCIAGLGEKAPKPGGWITAWDFNGYGADSAEFLGAYASVREGLNKVSDRHIIFLTGSDGHVYAANDYALAHGATLHGRHIPVNGKTLQAELAGYREYFQLDSDGEPTGIIKDAGAYDLFDYDRESVSSLVARADEINEYFFSAGVTSAQEAWAKPRDVAVFRALAEQGALQVRMSLALAISRDRHMDDQGRLMLPTLLAEVERVRRELQPLPMLRVEGVKVMLDGVIEFPTQTAALYDHYLKVEWDERGRTKYKLRRQDCSAQESPCDGPQFNYGILELSEADLKDAVVALDKADLTVHFHALGDRAVTLSLDAIAAARAANTGSSLPHNIAHFQQVSPEDTERFGALGAFITPSMSWLAPWHDYDKTVIPYVSETRNVNDLKELYRQDSAYIENLYPIKRIMDAGALVSAGSDAPVDGALPRPFTDIMYGLLRGEWVQAPGSTDPADRYWASFNRSERLKIEDLLDAYTINGARALRQEQLTGSLEVGKKADVVIINHDIIAAAHTLGVQGPMRDYTAAAHTICDYWLAEHCRTRVEATYIDGKLVYSAAGTEATPAIN
ncbi:MAG: amidohydrolase family protein [Halieaceae bacterium]